MTALKIAAAVVGALATAVFAAAALAAWLVAEIARIEEE